MIKVLHVIGAANPGGTEKWLAGGLRYVDRGKYCFEFCVFSDSKGLYEQRIKELGGEIVRCTGTRWGLGAQRFRAQFVRLVTSNAYDIVHSHVDLFSGVVLRLAQRAGVRVRIAHAHTAAPIGWTRPARRFFFGRMRQAIATHATLGLAASNEAACRLFGPAWARDWRWRVLHCGIDLAPFESPVDRAAIRQALALPEGAKVVGYVGRLAPGKNLALFLEIFELVARSVGNAYCLIVGDGQEKDRLVEKARRLGDRVKFVGFRSDVPAIMRAAIDVLCLPSEYEGLPLSILEAQAAGLPAVLSSVITQEVDLIPSLITRCDLDSPAHTWAERVIERLASPRESGGTVAAFQESEYSMRYSMDSLCRLYSEATEQPE